ncbi:MAG: leucine-rich repeat protein, partial [Eubacterium sp.]|nr:leucine-rich repeat protein [Eubacterium sp.]
PKRTASPDEPLVESHTNKSGQDVTTVTKVDEEGNKTETKTVTDPKTGEMISSTVSWITEDPKTGAIITESKTIKNNGSIILGVSTETEDGKKVSSTYRVKDVKKNTLIAAGTTLTGGDGVVIIPGSVTIHGVAYKVKSIAKAAFRSNSTTKKIIVESGIKSIGEQAFCKSAVTSVRIGKTVRTIGEKAFLDAPGLKEIEIRADKLKSIGKDAFKGTAEGLTILIYADKKTYKHIVKMIMDSGKLPKKVKFKRKKN